MNGESILDAMNYLDDDLIAATAKIRQRKKRPYLYVMAAAAACLCLLLIPQNEKSFAPTEADNAFSGLTDRYYGDTKAEAPAENAPEVPAAGTANSASVIAVTVCVTELRDDAFVGSVTTDADGSVRGNEEIIIQCDAAVLAHIKVGDTLRIQYRKGERNTLLEYQLVTDHE